MNPTALPFAFLFSFLLQAHGFTEARLERVEPFLPRTRAVELLREWNFKNGREGWKARRECRLSAQGGLLLVETLGPDPYLGVPVRFGKGRFLLRLRMFCAGVAGPGQVFWTTAGERVESETKSARFPLLADGKWHDYEVPFTARGDILSLRLDPGSGRGLVKVERISLFRAVLGPLAIEAVRARPGQVNFRVRNVGEKKRSFRFRGKTYTLSPGDTVALSLPLGKRRLVRALTLEVETAGFPSPKRTLTLFDPRAAKDLLELHIGDLRLRVSPEGTAALIEKKGVLLGALAPLVLAGDTIPRLSLEKRTSGSLTFTGNGIHLRLFLEGEDIGLSIRSPRAVEGPVLRGLGPLEKGLFAGLEYLGKGESSSSTRDIETRDHIRFAPDPLDVTIPLMACRTDRGLLALTWKDMALQPVFATPDFLDGTGEHRMGLRGKRIDAAVLAADLPLEESILWAVKKMGGLPPPPEPPRSGKEQFSLCLRALEGPLRGPGGWGHCAEPRWTRRFYGDMVSCLFHLTGKVPETPGLVPGGAHVRDNSAFFLTGRAGRWLRETKREIRRLAASQRKDGTWAYRGPFRKGHFEDTASGYCAVRAFKLLESARLTGDRKAREAGLRALEGMKRFQVPRGAQTWELSLHTPDILASAYLVRAYTLGFELAGKKEYLEAARRWALSGVPFVYLWSRYPWMLYLTPPVYGATHYKAPLWIGRPVPWCGVVYAWALAGLARHDRTLDWRRLAWGILRAAQKAQYPSGPPAGCLPDVLELRTGRRAGPSINPCALVTLQLALEGKAPGLHAAPAGGRLLTAPFPITVKDGDFTVHGPPGLPYQVLLDGKKILIARGTWKFTGTTQSNRRP